MNWRTALIVMLALAVPVAACSDDPTMSDEYRALEQELATSQQQLTEEKAELSAALVALEDLTVPSNAMADVPSDVLALIDEWWAANDRADGSVVDLYRPTGYHLYGNQKIALDELAGHLSGSGSEPEWITEPHLIAAEPEGRYVVTRGIRISSGGLSWATALTFEIVTLPDGELRIAQTDFTYANG